MEEEGLGDDEVNILSLLSCLGLAKIILVEQQLVFLEDRNKMLE